MVSPKWNFENIRSSDFYDKINPHKCNESKFGGYPMSIAVGLIGSDGIIMATDSQLTRSVSE